MTTRSYGCQTLGFFFVFVWSAIGFSLFAAADDPYWLWVVGYTSGIGIPNASIEIWPEGKPEQIVRYITGRAGRVLVPEIPDRFDCRVTQNGRELHIRTTSQEMSSKQIGNVAQATAERLKYTRSLKVSQASITVDIGDVSEPDGGDWNSSTSTRFRSYVQDENARELIEDVLVKAVRSGAISRTDANGLFTL
jgi:hypothetical protein